MTSRSAGSLFDVEVLFVVGGAGGGGGGGGAETFVIMKSQLSHY